MRSLSNWLLDLASNYVLSQTLTPTRPPLTMEQELGLLSQLWQNESFRKYLDTREEELIHSAVERVVEGKLSKGEGLAGQLLEIRKLRVRTKAAHDIIMRRAKEKSLLKQGQTS